jgi:hypothetical protein
MALQHLYQFVGWACLIAAVAPALWRGGWPERCAAGAMIAAWFGSALTQNTLQMWGPQTGVVIIDLMLLAVLLILALTTDRWWPMWASGFHGLGVLLHLAVLLDSKIWGRAYFIAGTVFSVLTLTALFVGALGRRPPAHRPPDAASPLT